MPIEFSRKRPEKLKINRVLRRRHSIKDAPKRPRKKLTPEKTVLCVVAVIASCVAVWYLEAGLFLTAIIAGCCADFIKDIITEKN